MLGIADFWLMRRYARLDPPPDEAESERGAAAAVPAPSY